MNPPSESRLQVLTGAERAAARLLDLLRTGVALAIGLLPATCAELLGQNFGPASSEWELRFEDFEYLGSLESLPLMVFGVLVALGYELVRLARKGTTAGKASMGLELRVARESGLAASRKRALSRYLVSVGACVAASGLAFAVAAALGILWSPSRVVVLAVASCAAVWVSCLLTASMRVDGRGWHDLVAGTVLVSATGLVRPQRRGPGDEGFDRWQGFMRGGDPGTGSGS